MPEYFGIYLKHTITGYKLTRENYAVISNRNSLRFNPFASDKRYADESGTLYTDKWVKKTERMIMKNFDLNMKFYSLLDRNEFNRTVDFFLLRNPGFKQITDLELYHNRSGHFLLVLDDYCQVYIGKTSVSLKKSILGHWSKQMPFDRLLYPEGAVNTSTLSIGCFRAFDTTRIYIYESDMDNDILDENFLEGIPYKFLCNRLVNGISEFDLLQEIEGMET